MAKADIGVFGGSGFYELLENPQEVEVETPYGAPSAPIMIGAVHGKNVAFLPRHGAEHQYPPHAIPYRANLWTMKELGVRKVLGPCATGSLKKEFKPGDFVICDQFVDRTQGRNGTFYDGAKAVLPGPHGKKTAHISSADPYCPALRRLALEKANGLGIEAHDGGTVVVIQGPRFSTRAESRWFANAGFGVINMTQYPECILARELEMCYVNISLITDYDVGVEGKDIEPVTNEMVLKTFQENNKKVKNLLLQMLEEIDHNSDCSCHHATDGAFMG